MRGERRGQEVIFTPDPINEETVIAAALADPSARSQLLQRLRPDAFLVPEHQAIWEVLHEMQRRQLEYDPATLAKLGGRRVDVERVVRLQQARPDVPGNLEFHVRELEWDRAKHVAVTGPINSLLEAVQDPRCDPDRVRALAAQVPQAFEGSGGRQHLLDNERLIHETMEGIRNRGGGQGIYPYGIHELDYFDPRLPAAERKRRMVPGAAPGLITVVLGTSGSGKSVFAAHLALAQMRQRRRVQFFAWEMNGNMTLELLALMSLGWSRSDAQEGRFTEEELAQLEARMRLLAPWIRFVANPFWAAGAQGKRRFNEQNLDLLESYVADGGCDVCIYDLWERCLVDSRPEEEGRALKRMQAMTEERKVHSILVHQLRLKDLEAREDTRPTRESVKGSGVWIEVPDTIFAVHRPGLYKPVADNTMDVSVLKQRHGRWPFVVEFEWDGDKGRIANGRAVDYVPPSRAGAGDPFVDINNRVAGGNVDRARARR